MGVKCPKCNTDNPDTQKFCGECATPLPPSKEIPVTETLETPKEELTTGSTFAGRYQIIEELGKGGMGKVYKAQDTEIKEKVALKLLKPEIAADKKTIERFQNELKFARKISHRNVCRMYDLNKEESSYYITMEYVPGEDLKSTIIRIGQLPIAKTIFIAKQVCEGLEEAHGLDVVHRDLKPQNIMIDKEGNARIMDFGIARSVTGKGITGAGVMIGTPEYMSPEQVEGKDVDQRSDIYSLGVILYEMVTGRVPFEGETPLSIAVRHKTETPQEPRELNTQIPEDLSRVILRCMDKDKEKRYQSAGEVHSELENIEKGIPTTERIVPKRKPITSREITVTFGLKKLFIPGLVIVALIIAAVIIWQLLPQKEAVPIPSDKPSIAVLPFEDLSPQQDQGYLCDGFAETLINALTKINKLRVPARTSSFAFKSQDQNVAEIGEKLNVKTVLEGSVQKAGNRVRITAQLINVADESLLWSEQYNRELNDVFVIQDEIAMAIADNLKLNLLGKEKENLLKHYTENIDAYNLYLKGRYFWNKRTADGLREGIGYFEQAIEIDPDYALAYAGLADTYVLLPFYAGWQRDEAYSKARASVLKALELENRLVEAQTSFAYMEGLYNWDWAGAERAFKKALKLNPGYATCHHWYAELLKALGRIDEAIKEIKIALELDPLSLVINRNFGTYLYLARRYDEAIEQLQKTLEMSPDFPKIFAQLGYAYLQKEMHKEAVEAFKRGGFRAGLAHAYAALGNREEALSILREYKERSLERYVDPFIFAGIYVGLGEIDKAFEALERAYQQRSPLMVDFIYLDPIFDDIRSDPRFTALLKKIGLE
jgi:serine/threonine protein kinase/Tfp pilus assembly protein PilF